MANNTYFTLQTTTLDEKRFTAVWDDDASVDGIYSPKTVKFGVTGSVLVTVPQQSQNSQILKVKFEGDEADPYGTYEELRVFFQEGSVTFTHWDGSTSYEVVFMNETLDPSHLSPILYPMFVNVQFLEIT